MGQQGQHWWIGVRIHQSGRVLDFRIVSPEEQETYDREPCVAIRHLVRTIDRNLDYLQSDRFTMCIGKRNRIAVVVFRIIGVGMATVLMWLRMICRYVIIMVMIQIGQIQQHIVRRRHTPQRQCETGDASNQDAGCF